MAPDNPSNHLRGIVLHLIANCMADGGDDPAARRKVASDRFGAVPESLLVEADRLALIVMEERFLDCFAEIVGPHLETVEGWTQAAANLDERLLRLSGRMAHLESGEARQ